MTGDGAFLPGVHTTQKCKGPFYQGRGRVTTLSQTDSKIPDLQRENLGCWGVNAEDNTGKMHFGPCRGAGGLLFLKFVLENSGWEVEK